MKKSERSPGFHAKTVQECWAIARAEAERYQRAMGRARDAGEVLTYEVCKVARNAADRIALEIRYGRKKREK